MPGFMFPPGIVKSKSAPGRHVTIVLSDCCRLAIVPPAVLAWSAQSVPCRPDGFSCRWLVFRLGLRYLIRWLVECVSAQPIEVRVSKSPCLFS